jgi:hypothetical protein
LFHTETIELDDFARENDVLILVKLVHDGSVVLELQVIVANRNWSDSWRTTACVC